MPSALDLPALHDAFACGTTAVLQAWRGHPDSALLSLLEAQAAAEEAFGSGSSEAEALSVVFAAIKQTAGLRCSQHPGPALTPQPSNRMEHLR
jgi:hypothetical protein